MAENPRPFGRSRRTQAGASATVPREALGDSDAAVEVRSTLWREVWRGSHAALVSGEVEVDVPPGASPGETWQWPETPAGPAHITIIPAGVVPGGKFLVRIPKPACI